MTRKPVRRRRRAPVRKRKARSILSRFGLSRFGLATRVVAAIAAVAVLSVLWAIWTYQGPGPRAKDGAAATTVVLQRGQGMNQIATTLAKAGVIGSRDVFLTAAKLSGSASKLKAGEYEFRSGTSMARVLADIRDGRVVRRVISVPEGWTSQMAADAVEKAPWLTGLASAPPEGSILPDTYLVQRGEDRGAVLKRMTDAQKTLLAELWAARQPGLPLRTPQEAVTLASIVEKETGLALERPRIAAVFINRLNSGMRLESDPTIIYGLTQGRPLGRGILASELARVTPYNTYRIDGLPPTPIANPGRESLHAVLNPPKTNELFFVASGNGGHVFASTYAEHQGNVARWRAVERMAAAK